jgi:hypothetical protein
MKFHAGLVAVLVLSSIWAQGEKADENVDYTVSPTGKYVVKIARTKDWSEETVCVVETANPRHRFNLEGISGGKGVSVSFSPDEDWLEVDDSPAVHDCEPKLYRHIAGARFESLASMDVMKQVLDYLEGVDLVPELVSLEHWEPDCSGFTLRVSETLDVKKRMGSCDVFYSILQGRPTRKTDPHYSAGGTDEAAESKNYEDDRRKQRQLQEQQLNVIYGVLKRKLDPQAQEQLLFEERKWIADREKSKTDPNSDWDTMTHDRINQLAERVLQL